ncbi:hypothetical protein C8J57DRAFT_1344697 [Mycena rebaudengoi]|nr:hypothetical protein C8J57DRAFT_1344697 [Mycena rebaudengoi]
MSHPCPSIPLELEREIFEIAATHHPETMPTLLLVAQRVLQWIEPLLYRTLVVGRTTLVLSRIAAQRLDPADLLHLQPAKLKHVQHLFLWDSSSDLLPVLPLCVHVEWLGLRSEDPLILTAFEAMPLALQHFSFINSSTLGAIDPSRPLFRTLTHLDMSAGAEGQPLDFQMLNCPPLHTWACTAPDLRRFFSIFSGASPGFMFWSARCGSGVPGTRHNRTSQSILIHAS